MTDMTGAAIRLVDRSIEVRAREAIRQLRDVERDKDDCILIASPIAMQLADLIEKLIDHEQCA